MVDLKDEIARMIESSEEASYQRGWKDACETMKLAVDAIMESSTEKGLRLQGIVEPRDVEAPRRTGRPASPTIGVVEDCINRAPGMKGVDVVNAVQTIDSSIPERTIRTALRRLKIHKRIWQREGRWYPKPQRQRDLLETNDEEANSSPPHH